MLAIIILFTYRDARDIIDDMMSNIHRLITRLDSTTFPILHTLYSKAPHHVTESLLNGQLHGNGAAIIVLGIMGFKRLRKSMIEEMTTTLDEELKNLQGKI